MSLLRAFSWESSKKYRCPIQMFVKGNKKRVPAGSNPRPHGEMPMNMDASHAATFHQGNPPHSYWQWRYVPVGGGRVGGCLAPASCRVGLRWTWTCDALPGAGLAAPNLQQSNLKQLRRLALPTLAGPSLHYRIHSIASIKKPLAPDSQRGTARKGTPGPRTAA